jgi:hypothetical protein
MQTIVSPAFALEWRDVDDFLGEFGPYNGRYVPRFPKDWLEQLRHHLDEVDSTLLPPKERAALFERLRRELLHCTSPTNWPWDSAKSWSENLLSASSFGSEILVAGDALDPAPFKTWSQISGEVKRTRHRTLNFNGLVSTYVSLCKPLLLNAPSAFLIDPYLDPFSDDFENLLLSFFDLISGSKCYSIELITRRQACGDRNRMEPRDWLSDDEIQLKLKDVYGARLPKDRQLRVHLVQEAKKDDEGLTLHNRFFLTNHGAINFGHGFKISRHTKSTQDAFIVDKQHHETLKAIYINGVARFSDNLPKRSEMTYPRSVTTLSLMR